MDLNTGIPIQNPSTQLPPVPQQSPTLPSFVDPVSSTAAPLPSMPPVSGTPADLPPLDDVEHSQAFVDTLSALKDLSAKTTEASLEAASTVSNDSQTSDTESSVAQPPQQVQDATPVVPSTPVVEIKTQAEPDISTLTPPVSAPVLESTLTPTPQQEPIPVTASPQLPDAVMAPFAPVGNIPMSGAYETKKLLDIVVQKDASDLHLVVGYPPMIRVDGDLVTVGSTILDPKMAKELVYSVLPDDKKEQLEVNREVDLAYQHEGAGRFRINAYWQRGYISGAFRLIPTRIRTIDELKLPPLFHKFADMEQGLVLVTGPTGHGKSTTLASVIHEINMKHPKHILTIEDPIEYVFPQQKALVSQRELGDDTHSWKGALRSALREDPDVVLVGEMRDLETISAAITVAETGHLVFATLHTNNAAQTIQRIVNMYPDVQQEEIRSELADVLEAVVAQRLIPVKGGGRRAALEVMLMTPAIRNLIRENKIYQIDNIIRTSMDVGMITLEKSLLTFFREELISQEDALRYALDATEMARLLEELV